MEVSALSTEVLRYTVSLPDMPEWSDNSVIVNSQMRMPVELRKLDAIFCIWFPEGVHFSRE